MSADENPPDDLARLAVKFERDLRAQERRIDELQDEFERQVRYLQTDLDRLERRLDDR